MRLATFTTNIVVNGKALEEYDVVIESPTRATCWVASEEGKPFGVQWKCHEENRTAATQGVVYVDGTACGGKANFPGTLGVHDTSILSSHIDETHTRDLMFSRIQLTDDDSLLNKEVHKNLGEISLVVIRGVMIREARPTFNEARVALGNNEKLHERSKKATVHCVGFGPKQAWKPAPYFWRVIRNNQPSITFVFKYRPLSVLQANGIAPRPTLTNTSAGAENGPSERDAGIIQDDDRTSEDIKPAELNDRIQSLEKELKRLRDLQTRNSEDRKPKRIKTEDLGQRRRLLSPTIIDLT